MAFQDFVDMKIGTVVALIITTVLLPTADNLSDIFVALKLFTGYGLKKSHPKYGALTLVPIIMSLIGVSIHWLLWKSNERPKMERDEEGI